MDAPGDLSERGFRLGVFGVTAAVAAFLLARLHAWPPHEDETLALFVGSKPLHAMLDTVLDLRGGAPLHYLIVNLVSHVSPSLTALRLVSTAFAVASVPVVAALAARLTNRTTGLAATALAAASWTLLFHGIYGRMYSLFLFLSGLSFLALLRAVERRRPLDWALWALAVLATISAHQYGAFVLGAAIVYVLLLARRRRFSPLPALVATAVAAVAAIPVWRSSLVLADRVDVGIGGSGTWLGGPWPFLEYLRRVLGDFAAGWTAVFAVVAVLAALGVVALARERRASALLVGLAFAAPAAGLVLTHVGSSASAPETRHLIFLLPFFATLVAVGLTRVARLVPGRTAAVLAAAVPLLMAAEVAWGWHETPALYAGEPAARKAARLEAQRWLAHALRPSDVLFGYEPLYLGALGGRVSNVVVPRADPTLALETLLRAPKPLGRGVWVLDATEGARIVNDWSQRLHIEDRSPGPQFATHVFGPFLIVLTRRPTGTPETFLSDTLAVQSTGESLYVDDSVLNYRTAEVALERLEARRSVEPAAAPDRAP